MIYKARRLAVAAALLAAGVLSASTAHAASPQPKGITVSPAYRQVDVTSGQPSVPLKFIITNHEATAQTIDLTTQDFNTLYETGGLVFVGSNPTALQKKYGLAKWISLPQKQITIQPNHTSTIDGSILNLPSLAPGGHYGALLLSLNNGQLISGNVNLHPIASSLLFVTKSPGDTHQLALTGVTADHSLFNLPTSVSLNFHNVGNTHVVPRGTVSILAPGGRLVSKAIINQDSDIILPQAYRLLRVQLKPVSGAQALGQYTLQVDFRIDGTSQYRRYQTSFWIIHWYVFLIIGIIIVALLAFAGYRNLRSWRQ